MRDLPNYSGARVLLLGVLAGAAWLEWRFRWLPAGFSVILLILLAGCILVYLARQYRMGRL